MTWVREAFLNCCRKYFILQNHENLHKKILHIFDLFGMFSLIKGFKEHLQKNVYHMIDFC